MWRLLLALYLLPLRLRKLMAFSPAPDPCPDFLPDLYDLPTTDHLNHDRQLLNCRDWLEHCLHLDPAYHDHNRRSCNHPDLNP